MQPLKTKADVLCLLVITVIAGDIVCTRIKRSFAVQKMIYWSVKALVEILILCQVREFARRETIERLRYYGSREMHGLVPR